MDYSIIISVLGIIASYFFFRWQMKKNKIVHYLINSYDIGKGLTAEFPDFNLHFGGDVLSDNVMVIKGGLINMGRNDINGLKGDGDIKLFFPQEYKVKAISLSQFSDGLNVKLSKDKMNDNSVNVGIKDLFKTKEFIKYTAIVEVPNKGEFSKDKITFQHRIPNTNIKSTYIGPYSESLKRKADIAFRTILFILFALFLVSIPLTSIDMMRYQVYKKSTGEQVKMYVDRESKIHVIDDAENPFFNEGYCIKPEEFNKDYKVSPIADYRWFSTNNAIYYGIFIYAIYQIVFFYYIFFGKYISMEKRRIINVITRKE